jgi:hypothetical protein
VILKLASGVIIELGVGSINWIVGRFSAACTLVPAILEGVRINKQVSIFPIVEVLFIVALSTSSSKKLGLY